jgi:predicted RNA binding protein YcfA (HicA-like mRNA interferase family)
MTGAEFLRLIERFGRDRGVPVRFDQRHGKGSHGTLWYGPNKTVLKDRKKEIGKGLLHAMLKQLGLERSDLR